MIAARGYVGGFQYGYNAHEISINKPMLHSEMNMTPGKQNQQTVFIYP